MRTLNDMITEQLKDDSFHDEYKAIQPEMDAIKELFESCFAEVNDKPEKAQNAQEKYKKRSAYTA